VANSDKLLQRPRHLTHRRQRDTQKLAQAILAANDQRLKAIRLAQHQAEQVASSITPGAARLTLICRQATVWLGLQCCNLLPSLAPAGVLCANSRPGWRQHDGFV
jgi:hypothetical protein